MTRDEVAKILAVISTAYPNFKVENKSTTVDTWHFLLSEHSYTDISIALKTFINTSNSPFAPSVAELIGMTHKPAELAQMSDSEAWTMVRRAISRGNYYAEDDFAKFPPAVQKVVGSPSQLRLWAQDTEFNEGVESSNFYKRYNTEIKRENEMSWMPSEARAKLQSIQQMLLEDNNGI